MPNPYVNKVSINGVTKIDLTADTVIAEKLAQGYTAHDASGAPIVGSMDIPDLAVWQEGGYVYVSDTIEAPAEIYSDNGYVVLDIQPTVPTLQSKSRSYTPSETAQSETVTADTGYDGLSSVAISVDAISSSYVGSGIARRTSSDLTLEDATVYAQIGYYEDEAHLDLPGGLRTSSDLTASGDTVTVPVGYYASQSTKAVASGTAGTPTATKGSVSNHSVSITPSVTNTSGYITGGTKNGTAVNVSASELVSGTLSITSSGTKDVTNYASASVAAGGATASATKGTVSNHSVSVTPSVTRTAGYITAGTANGTAVTVSASELVSGTKSIISNGTGIDVANYASVDVAVPSDAPTLETVTKSYTPTESSQSETVTPSTGYGGIAEIDITVGAISSTYVGSGIARKSSSDLTASGATVTVPAGYYSSQASKAVASGTAGTPTATKGTVSNHAVSVTPSVTNTAGYISGGTKTGTAVSVSASDLVSGTYTIGASGAHDVTNYASASVAAGGATASATKGTVSNHSVSVTPSVTRTAGYITAGTANGTAVTVSASELVSGTFSSVTSYGTYDVTNYQYVQVPGGSVSSPTATKGTVSNHSVSVTPSVNHVRGFIDSGTKNGTAVTVSASELVSGTLNITENGSYNVTNYEEVNVLITPDVLFEGSITASATGGTTLDYSVDDYEWLEFTFKDDSSERFYSQRLHLAEGLKTSLSYVFNASSIAYVASVDVRVDGNKLYMGNNYRLQVAFNGSAHVSASNSIYLTGVYGYK